MVRGNLPCVMNACALLQVASYKYGVKDRWSNTSSLNPQLEAHRCLWSTDVVVYPLPRVE